MLPLSRHAFASKMNPAASDKVHHIRSILVVLRLRGVSVGDTPVSIRVHAYEL